MALRRTYALLTNLSNKHPLTSAIPTQTKPKTTILEVERKFRRLTVPSLTNLTTTTTTTTTTTATTTSSSAGVCNPPFKSVVSLPTRHIHDIYYDTPRRTLSAACAWVRLRNGMWQAKVRQGGDFVNSRFEELKGARDVGQCVAGVLGGDGGGGSGISGMTVDGSGRDQQFKVGAREEEEEEQENFGLSRLAEFVTTRYKTSLSSVSEPPVPPSAFQAFPVCHQSSQQLARTMFHTMDTDIIHLGLRFLGLLIALSLFLLALPGARSSITDSFPPGLLLRFRRWRKRSNKIPISVNYHFTRRCNKTCGFCFHTATTSHIEDLDAQKHALRLLAQAGMRKINFAGGEPFLYPKRLGDMVEFCKKQLRLESVSIVTNGSLVKESWLRRWGPDLDILAVSCDSFNEETNIAIGRGSGDQVEKLYQIAERCRQYGVMFKINTVVNKLNVREDMNEHISKLKPFRWKCFQVLIVQGENDSEETLRDGHKFTITDEEFDEFCERHEGQGSMVPEPNRLMAKSYLILDEYLRFLDRTGKQPSQSILEVGVEKALESVFWDEEAFVERKGLFEWTKPEGEKGCCGEENKELDW
ncbi:hypothetical protein VTJ49DRAFT_4465 [Mycothermus thermophilus]|uniref:Radical SAM core domain-containing protein n=1 Tax=Humicola insolens TaxID=85995 RepID=A0ABR3VP12_HUMIN